jgi:vacuolar protein sorting-associated protein 51
MRETLRTTHLESLLMKHIEMSTEIKSLDSDMQMLVYENYNKFIYATETIRSMKSNVDGMDANMRELKQLIGVRPHLCSSFRFTF